MMMQEWKKTIASRAASDVIFWKLRPLQTRKPAGQTYWLSKWREASSSDRSGAAIALAMAPGPYMSSNNENMPWASLWPK